MSMEAACRLLDLAGIEGEGTAPRLTSLFSENGQADNLDADDKAAVLLARLMAENHFAGLSAVRAGELLEVMADELAIPLRPAPLAAKVAEDLDAALAEVIGDLERRMRDLPSPERSDLRRRIGRVSKGSRAKVVDLPVGKVAEFARALEGVEDRLTAPTSQEVA